MAGPLRFAVKIESYNIVRFEKYLQMTSTPSQFFM